MQLRHRAPLYRWTRRSKLRRIHRSVSHLHGDVTPDLAPSEAIVLCVVRNGAPWLADFIAHHLDRGFRHIVLLDNDSTDGTVELARCKAVTVLHTGLPFARNNVLLRRYLVERFARRRWSLTVDVDELWDYAYSNEVELRHLLQHMTEQRANAMVAHMLDLFAPTLPRRPLPLDAYCHYDLAQITRDGLDCDRGFRHCGFEAVAPGVTEQGLYRGGVRARVFGLETVWLSKMPLLYFDGEIAPLVHPHFSHRARIADTSSVLLHYKMIHTFRDQVAEALRRKQHFQKSSEYTHYHVTLQQTPEPSLLSPTTRTLRSVDQLVDEGFLAVSGSFRELIAERRWPDQR